MKKLALVLSLVSLFINVLTMMYIESELAGIIPSSWRLIAMGVFVIIAVRQVLCLRRGYPQTG